MRNYIYLFTTAILLAISSTYCTIKGISQVFSANILAVSCITAILEFGKYGSMFTLTKRWSDVNYKRFKYVLACIVCFMTVLSSAGIFSFYATSYVRSSKPIASYTVELDSLEAKIKNEKDIINRAKLQQDQINNTINRYIELDRLSQSQTVRKQNQNELNRLDKIISDATDNINEYSKQKIDITAEISKIKQESGFITNIASTLKIDLTTDPDGEFKVVLIIIGIILLAMEPLSLFSMVMGHIEYKKYKEDISKVIKENNIINNKDIQTVKPCCDPKFFGESTYTSLSPIKVTVQPNNISIIKSETDITKNTISSDDVNVHENMIEEEIVLDNSENVIKENYISVNAEIDKERKPNTVEVNEVKTSID